MARRERPTARCVHPVSSPSSPRKQAGAEKPASARAAKKAAGGGGALPRFGDRDIWTEVCKYLHGAALIRLSLTSRWFQELLAEAYIWRYAFLRDVGLPTDMYTRSLTHGSCSWRFLYCALVRKGMCFFLPQQQKHIDFIRSGGFVVDDSSLLLTVLLLLPLPIASTHISIEEAGACLLTTARPGIWITNAYLAWCHVSVCACSIDDCDGTLQVLEARHCELHLDEGFSDGLLEHEDLGEYYTDKEVDTAAAAFINASRLSSQPAADVLHTSWTARREVLMPSVLFRPSAVAVSTNLVRNEGLYSRVQAVRHKSSEGQIVSVRITQHLM